MPKTILIVDDDEDQHEIMGMLLRYHGFSTLHARSVREARSVLAETRPDAVLLDIMMPGQIGLDLLFSLHVTDPSLPVVVLTANPLASFRYPRAVGTAAAWLLKPALTSNVVEILNHLTEDKR